MSPEMSLSDSMIQIIRSKRGSAQLTEVAAQVLVSNARLNMRVAQLKNRISEKSEKDCKASETRALRLFEFGERLQTDASLIFSRLETGVSRDIVRAELLSISQQIEAFDL